MKITINLGLALNEEQIQQLKDCAGELVRCKNLLDVFFPTADSLSDTDLENWLFTDKPQLREKVESLLKTIAEERKEIRELLTEEAFGPLFDQFIWELARNWRARHLPFLTESLLENRLQRILKDVEGDVLGEIEGDVLGEIELAALA